MSKYSKLLTSYIIRDLSKEEVDELISVGDPITRERTLIEMGPMNGR